MALKDELGLVRDLEPVAHEGLLNVYYTAALLKKLARGLFRPFGITDVQFNVLQLLAYHTGEQGGLTQAELGHMMLVNRANITPLIDRMEKAGLVVRSPVPGDRRYHLVQLTPDGRKLLTEVEEKYRDWIDDLMGRVNTEDLEQLIASLGVLRGQIYTAMNKSMADISDED